MAQARIRYFFEFTLGYDKDIVSEEYFVFDPRSETHLRIFYLDQSPQDPVRCLVEHGPLVDPQSGENAPHLSIDQINKAFDIILRGRWGKRSLPILNELLPKITISNRQIFEEIRIGYNCTASGKLTGPLQVYIDFETITHGLRLGEYFPLVGYVGESWGEIINRLTEKIANYMSYCLS